jgi:hypothetical protein
MWTSSEENLPHDFVKPHQQSCGTPRSYVSFGWLSGILAEQHHSTAQNVVRMPTVRFRWKISRASRMVIATGKS